MSATEDFVRGLTDTVPELRGVLNEHMSDNDELLPHVFMGDVARFAAGLQESSTGSNSEATLTALLDYLEDGIRSGAAEVRDMIAVSFLENLDPDVAGWSSLRERMGFALRRGLDRIHGE